MNGELQVKFAVNKVAQFELSFVNPISHKMRFADKLPDAELFAFLKSNLENVMCP